MKLFAPAALATYDELAKVANGRPIYLAGNSLGTSSALDVAANRPVAGLVLQNPPPLQTMIRSHYGWWNLWLVALPVSWQVPRELNSMINAPQVKAPAVFIAADGDTVVPPKYQHMVIDAYAGPKRVIEMRGGHNDSVRGDEEKRLGEGIEWLTRQAR
jgi:pimeloyl-ACP methyl ester carboxylesterase